MSAPSATAMVLVKATMPPSVIFGGVTLLATSGGPRTASASTSIGPIFFVGSAVTIIRYASASPTLAPFTATAQGYLIRRTVTGSPTFAPFTTTNAAATTGGWKTMFNTTGYSMTAGYGWGGLTIAQSIDIGAPGFNTAFESGGSQMRLTITGSNTFIWNSIYIGPRSTVRPNGFDPAGTTHVLFGGSSGGSIPGGGTLVSDVFPAFDASNGVFVKIYCAQDNPGVVAGSVGGLNVYYLSGDDSSSLNATGYLTSTFILSVVTTIERFE
jgi:hypothetical protein